jgi:hypothetical protein
MQQALFWPGRAFYWEIATHALSTGANADADAPPTVVVARNGVADGAVVVTVTHPGTGEYGIGFTVPSGYLTIDTVVVRISATMGGVPVKAKVNAVCPTLANVAGKTFDQYMGALAANVFGVTAVSDGTLGKVVQFFRPDGTLSHTIEHDGTTDGKRVTVTFA